MARTVLNRTTLLGSNGNYNSANVADVTMTAATGSSGSNGNYFVATGRDIILVQNTGGTAATVTVTSAPDPWGRTRDITTYSLAAGAIAAFGPLEQLGWVQSSGQVYLEASTNTVKFGILSF